jgi:hypothetical protein
MEFKNKVLRRIFGPKERGSDRRMVKVTLTNCYWSDQVQEDDKQGCGM